MCPVAAGRGDFLGNRSAPTADRRRDTSFQSEGMVLIDMASRITSDFRVITLDTGRLPEETHSMIETVYERYGVRVEVAVPDAAELSAMVARHGTNLFHHDNAWILAEFPRELTVTHINRIHFPGAPL